MYLVLGSSVVGYAIAEILKKRNEELLIIDKDPSKIRELTKKGFKAIEGDFFSSSSQIRRVFERAKVIFIVTSKSDINVKLLDYVPEINPDAFLIVRGFAVKDLKNLKKRGADLVVIPQVAIAEQAIEGLNKVERFGRMRRLSSILKKGERLGIVIHDNPDPDAIASAMALKLIASKMGTSSDILYGGEIGHQQNKIFVNLLHIELIHVDEYTKYLLRGYDRLAFVDLASEANTSIMPSDSTPDIIIDHHQPTQEYALSYEDMRTHIGAVSTMLTEYLIDFDIEIDDKLATALMYGIMTDTNNFRRKFSREDIEAISHLKSKIDQEILTQIESPTISPDVLDVIGKAVLNREIVNGYVLTNVGYISNRDSLPQAAEYLLNLEGVKTVLVFGMMNDSLYISGRTKDVKLNLGQSMDKAFSSIGSAGGHMSSAGAKIPLGIFGMIDDKDILKNLAGEAIKKMFFKSVGVY